MELRRFTRAPLGQPASFVQKNDDARIGGLAKDISVGGMFLQTETPAPFGAEIVVSFALPGDSTELRLPGIVRWVRPDGMGVQFGNLGARDTHAIIEFVRKSEAAL